MSLETIMGTAKADPKSLSTKLREVASRNSQSVHVVPSLAGWSVKKEGALRSSAVRATKAEAIQAARELKAVGRIVIHNQDGTIGHIINRSR